jgi:hypothetical protein
MAMRRGFSSFDASAVRLLPRGESAASSSAQSRRSMAAHPDCCATASQWAEAMNSAAPRFKAKASPAADAAGVFGSARI